MTLERGWLLGVARWEREALGRTIQYTETQAWDEPSVLEGWRNRDIVSHLAASELVAAAAMAGEAPAELEEFTRAHGGQAISVDAFNEWSVARRSGEGFRAVVREWGQAADLFLQRAAALKPEEWGARRVRWIAGEIGAGYLVQSRVMEWYLHGEDIRAGGDNPPRLEHPPIYCVNDLAIRMLPYSLALAGLSFPGRSALFRLEGVGGGAWHRGLGAREAPGQGKEPDAVVDGLAHAFCLVAGRRVPAEHYLAEGLIRTGGDDDLAEAVLQHVRAFA